MELRLNNKKDCARWSLLGIILSILGLLILVLDPATYLRKSLLTMREGSMIHNLWKKVPVEIQLDIYLFNITNSERFLKGLDKKLKFEEIGPYVFKESRENLNITYYENGTMSFRPSLSVVHVPELSVGDWKNDRFICTNLPFLGIFSNNGDASMFKKLGLNMIAKTLNAEGILNLSIEEFMWGYEDKLVRLASGYFPNWISFEKFGILDRMYADKNDVITIDLNETNGDLYTIKSWNGVSGLTHWGYTDENSSLPCNTLNGAYEGLLYPPHLQEGSSLTVYKKIFCRTLKLYHKNTTVTDSGLLGYLYELPNDALSCSNPENVCYCPDDKPCMPDGFSDISPCYYGLPITLSFPHFLGANETMLEKFEGLSPNETKHKSGVIIQPNLGMAMKVSSKIQLNIKVENVNFNDKLKHFSNMIIPILWMDAKVDKLPRDLELKVLFVFKYLPYIQKTTAWLLISVGIILFIYKSIMYLIVSIKIAQAKNQPSLTYMPVSTNENFENKKEKEDKAFD